MPASGRAQVDYTDIGFDAITLKIDGSTITYDGTQPEGIPAAVSANGALAVTWSADDTVALCSDGDPVIGKLLEVYDDSFCAVQWRGFCTLPAGASATVTRGRGVVGALGASSQKGFIRQDVSPGASYTQSEQVEQNRSRGRIWATGTTTAVVIDLG